MTHTVKKIGIAAIIALFLVVIILSVFSLPKGLNASPAVFKVSDYGSGENTGGQFWRGYAFTVSTQVTVTALIGGGTEDTFIVGLYEATPLDYIPTSLLAHHAFTTGGREQVGSLASSNVTLSPGTTYVLAQGAIDSYVWGDHYTVVTLNASDVVSGSPIINTWYPDNYSLRWHDVGDENFIVGSSVNREVSGKPAIGFHYLTAAPAVTKTETAPWVRNVQMTCYQVWINDDNNFEFVFWWEYKNNNWVKIYDMEGNEVFAIDMKYGNAKFEAELPAGMYTVKTFHLGETPIQEFIIGKP